jgi:ribosome biogenesis ATPase
MAPQNAKAGRPSLQTGLDKEVFQIVRKFQDDQPDGASPVPSVAAVYRYIQASNSSLKRKPKQLLNNSIDRVLAVLMDEQQENSEDGEMEDMEVDVDDLTGKTEKAANFMNRSIVGAFAPPTVASGTATPTTTTAGTNGTATPGKHIIWDLELYPGKQLRLILLCSRFRFKETRAIGQWRTGQEEA